MQFKKETLAKIAAKRVNLAFRRWKRPSVKAGDLISTSIGELTVVSCGKTAIARISANDLKRAGYLSRSALLKEFANHPGDVYRIVLRLKPAELPAAKTAAKSSATKTARNSATKAEPVAGSRRFAPGDRAPCRSRQQRGRECSPSRLPQRVEPPPPVP